MPCILHYNAKKIRNTISRLVRDLVGKMVQNIQEKKNPGPSNHFEQLVAKVSWSIVHVKNTIIIQVTETKILHLIWLLIMLFPSYVPSVLKRRNGVAKSCYLTEASVSPSHNRR